MCVLANTHLSVEKWQTDRLYVCFRQLIMETEVKLIYQSLTFVHVLPEENLPWLMPLP